MKKNYTLKELADIGAKEAIQTLPQSTHMCVSDFSITWHEHDLARQAFTKAILSAIGYELPKDEDREAFERWSRTHHIHDMEHSDAVFAAWKAGREDLRRSMEPSVCANDPDAKPKEPAWIPWEGGECPLADTVKRWEYKTRGGQCILTPHMPRSYRWWFSDDKDFNLDDILAYRVWEG